MRRFVEGVDRRQTILFPESLDDWVGENYSVRVIDACVAATGGQDAAGSWSQAEWMPYIPAQQAHDPGGSLDGAF
jgi:hypothetical protein